MSRKQRFAKAQILPVPRMEDLVLFFTWGFLGDATGWYPVPADDDEARAWWEIARRDVWSEHHRHAIPDGAKTYDQLSMDGLQYVRSHWDVIGVFPLAGARDALAVDRANLSRFSKTSAALAISDYLAMLSADLDEIEAMAVALALTGDDWAARKSPYQPMATYGGGA